jgi:hypothetical protein
VRGDEAEQVFFNVPLLLAPDPEHSRTEDRYYGLGVTNTGRPLFVVFTVRGEPVRVISIRDKSRRELRSPSRPTRYASDTTRTRTARHPAGSSSHPYSSVITP